jgi:hypothetical protein
MIEWYVTKADGCSERAKRKTDPRERSRLQHESHLWRQIADRARAIEQEDLARLRADQA